VTQDFLTARRSLIADACLRRLIECSVPDDDIVADNDEEEMYEAVSAVKGGLE
jgi:hypothetical protein